MKILLSIAGVAVVVLVAAVCWFFDQVAELDRKEDEARERWRL